MLVLSQLLLWAAVLIQGVVICVLIRQLGTLRGQAQKIEPWLPAGTIAPIFKATDLRTGSEVHSSDYSPSAVFCFVSSDCGSCRMLTSDIARQPPERLSHLIVCCVGTPGFCRESLARMPANVPILFADDIEVSGGFRITSWPVAVVLDETSKIAGYHNVMSFEDVEPLLQRGGDVVEQPALQGA